MQNLKTTKNATFGHYRTILSGYIFATEAHIGKKLAKQQYVLHVSPQYGELRFTSGWDPLVSFRHPCRFQRVSGLGSVTARQSSSGRQPDFAELNRERHLCSAGQPSCWVLAHILVTSVSLLGACSTWNDCGKEVQFNESVVRESLNASIMRHTVEDASCSGHSLGYLYCLYHANNSKVVSCHWNFGCMKSFCIIYIILFAL